MAKHVRKQIRDRITDALVAIDLFNGNVFQSRVYPLQQENLPGLLVYTLQEDSAREESPTDSMRDLAIVVQGVAAESADLDDVLDQIALEVEKTIDGLGELDGLAKNYLGIQSTLFTYVGEDVKIPHGAIAMEFVYTYRTASGSPDVAI